MSYLIFNQEEELLDVLTFDSDEELNLFKFNNPTYIIKNEDELNEEDDLFNIDDDDEW